MLSVRMKHVHFILFVSCFLKTVNSNCPPDSASFEIILNVDMKALSNLFDQSSWDNSDSDTTMTFFPQDPIKCTKDSDCSKQLCCGQKTAQCKKENGTCECFDSNKNEFGTRPIIFIQNIGSCGPSNAGCTICIDDSKTQSKIINNVPLNVSSSVITSLKDRSDTYYEKLFLLQQDLLSPDTSLWSEKVDGEAFGSAQDPFKHYLGPSITTPTGELKGVLPTICGLL